MTNKHQNKQEFLLSITGELLRQKGYLLTTIDEITERAGVAKGSFYSHFASKEEAVVMWLRQQATGWYHHIQDILAEPGSLQDKRERLRRWYRRVATEEGQSILPSSISGFTPILCHHLVQLLTPILHELWWASNHMVTYEQTELLICAGFAVYLGLGAESNGSSYEQAQVFLNTVMMVTNDVKEEDV